MVQVENEIGMLTEAREYTADANKAFNNEVPKELMDYLIVNKDSIVPELKEHWKKTNFATKGNWENVFGKSLATDELFQAWYYAKYTNAVAEAGKKEFRVSMYVNAALNYRNVQPGQYPSAGPLPHLMDIWQAAAPAIDFLSPDFYNPYFKHYCDLYTRRNNPLFIPEIRFEPSNAAKVFYAIGHSQAMGFSPFSIESTEHPEGEPIAKSYSILSQLSPEILKYSGTGKMDGVLLDTSTKKQEIVLGNYKLTVSHDYTLGWSPEAKNPDWPMSGAIIIQENENNFIVAGTGVVVTFTINNTNNKSAGILQAEEGIYKNGKWIPGRRMNGDQDHQGRHVRIPVGEWGIQKVKLYKYE
jgi:beta-galactosidase GanA